MYVINAVTMTEVGRCREADGENIAVCGNYACVTNVASGLRVLDISNPTNPHTVGSLPMPGAVLSDYTGSLAMDSAHAYVECGSGSDSCENSGISFVDISDPLSPHFVGRRVCLLRQLSSMTVRDGLLYLGSWAGLDILDVHDLQAPQWVSTMHLNSDGCFNVVLRRNLLLFAGQATGLRIFDISNPAAPAPISTTRLPSSDVEYIAVSGNTVYVQSEYAIYTMGISDSTAPALQGYYLSQHLLCQILQHGDHAIVNEPDFGLVNLDLSNPASPTQVGACGEIVEFQHAAKYENYIYAGSERPYVDGDPHGGQDGNGIHVIDVSSPAAPAEVRIVDARFHLMDVVVTGSYLYGYSGGLAVYSLADPADPHRISLLSTAAPRYNPRLLVAGQHLFQTVAAGVHIWDIVAPDTPVLAANFGGTDSMNGLLPLDIAVDQGVMYLPGLYTGLNIVDVTDPTHPSLCSLFPHPAHNLYYAVAVHAATAYLGKYLGGVDILDVSNPYSPALIDSFASPPPGRPRFALGNMKFSADGRHLIMPADSGGFHIYDISNAHAVRETGRYAVPDLAEDVLPSGDTVFVLGEYSLGLYDCADALVVDAAAPVLPPHEFALYPAYPNPFNPTTVIRISLPKRERAKLIVYDVTGRQVRVLSDGALDAGEHQFLFDGSGIASGVYFARLEAGKDVRTKKLVLIR